MDGLKNPVYVTQPLLPDLKDVNKRLESIWESKWLTNMGEQHKELEENLKIYLDVDNITLFNNGTLALLLGLKSLNLSGEVITTPFTFPATVETIEWSGLTPVFCDVELETGNIDATKIEALITDKTEAIVAVHVFGNPCDVELIQKIANKHNLKVIYDGAHSFGTTYKGKSISKYGDMTMYSFHATKLFHTIEGGSLVVKDHSLLEQLYLYKNFGIKGPEEVVLSGINAKLNELQAATGIECLKVVPEELKKRQRIKKLYKEGLKSTKGIYFVEKEFDGNSSLQYVAIRVEKEEYGLSRCELFELLAKKNIHARKYFYPLLSNLEWLKDYPSSDRDILVQANKLAKEVLVLPFYGELEEDVVNFIIESIQNKK